MEYERRIAVALPAERVFAIVADESRLTRWRDGLVAFRRLDDGSVPHARRYRETLDTPLGRRSVTVAVAIDPERFDLSFRVVDGPVRPSGAIVVRARDGGSEIAYRIRNESAFAIATPLDRRIFSALVASVDRSATALRDLLD